VARSRTEYEKARDDSERSHESHSAARSAFVQPNAASIPSPPRLFVKLSVTDPEADAERLYDLSQALAL